MDKTEYENHVKNKNHILIRLKEEYPFFIDKIIIKDGVKTITNNFHEASGSFCEYINLELNEAPVSIEYQRHVRFIETHGSDDYILCIENTEDHDLEMRLPEMEFTCVMLPHEIIDISTKEKRETASRTLEDRWLTRTARTMDQNEINQLLNGGKTSLPF